VKTVCTVVRGGGAGRKWIAFHAVFHDGNFLCGDIPLLNQKVFECLGHHDHAVRAGKTGTRRVASNSRVQPLHPVSPRTGERSALPNLERSLDG